MANENREPFATDGNATMNIHIEVREREIVTTRVFNAPRELVFSMWTAAEHLAAWWGPHGFTNPKCEADPRPGGKLLIHMSAGSMRLRVAASIDGIASSSLTTLRRS